MSEAKVSIRASYARLAATCMGRYDIRYYLNGVMVEPRTEGGAFIVGTDGHRLVAIIDKDAVCQQQTVLKLNTQTVAQLPLVGSRTDTGEAQVKLVDFAGRPALLVSDNLGLPKCAQVQDPIIETGSSRFGYPRWRTVLPDFEALDKVIAADPFCLQYAAEALTAFSAGERMASIRTWQAKAGGAIVFQIEKRENVLLLVMPRVVPDESSTAAWQRTWKPLREEKAAAPAVEPPPAVDESRIEGAPA